MRLRNDQLAAFEETCERHLGDKGVLGYACARNARMMTFANAEYIQARAAAIRRHGDEVRNDKGRVTGHTISPESEGWDAYREEMAPLDAMEHEVDVVRVPAVDLIGELSGAEMLALDFMIDWGDGDGDSDAEGSGD